MHALEQSSSEFSITRTYTEWLVNLPWGDYTADCSGRSITGLLLLRLFVFRDTHVLCTGQTS